jgi:hypothetical protein
MDKPAWPRLLAMLGALSAPAAAAGPTPATVVGLPASTVAGRGAAVPFVEYEAENASTTGRRVGPERSFPTLAAEASGRQAVLLERAGEYVEFTLGRDANAVTVRYAIPDSPDGTGIDATIGIYVGGERLGSLATTSRYAWLYGAYPFTNHPADGAGHHVFDEARLMLGRRIAAGTRVRLMVGPGDSARWYAIDLADFELVEPPKPAPAGAIPITRFGADPSGMRESSAAIRRAIEAARRRRLPAWIPPGRYRVERHIRVDRVTLAGAGPWYSILSGSGAGIYGRKAPLGSRKVILRDFAILGDVRERVDRAALAGVGGAMGGGSRIENLWIQHHKVGLWFDGPMDGIILTGLRILDNMADGLNFRRGVSNAVVENSFIRNSGDDGLAMWSHRDADHDNIFRNNTVVAPTLANGIAVYGGRDISIVANVVADTVTQGGGIHVGNRFDAVPVAGTIRLSGNMVVRSGSFDPNWRTGVGALWFYALDAPMTARIEVRDMEIADSTLPAVHFIGKRIEGVSFDRVAIRGAGASAVQLQSPGRAAFSNVIASGLRTGGILDCGQGLVVERGAGNQGWNEAARGGCRPDESSSGDREE